MYEVDIEGAGWLVDVAHPASISALESARGGDVSRFLANQGIPALNVSVLTSDNRYVTTMLAEIMRDAVLDDGTTPRGVHFGSKHGGAWCRAIWLPHQNEMPPGLRGSPLSIATPTHHKRANTATPAFRLASSSSRGNSGSSTMMTFTLAGSACGSDMATAE